MILGILNTFLRPQTHTLQVGALLSQTVPPDRIVCINNKPTETVQPVKRHPQVDYIDCSFNSKFHLRFAAALAFPCDFVAVFDCDTIPATGWLENCLNYSDSGILGGSGVRLLGKAYNPHEKYGHFGKHSHRPEMVHLVGHAWFMKKDHLRYMFYEEPFTYDNGEDIQLGYLAAKHGVKHFVPPHPPGSPEVWCYQKKYDSLHVGEAATSIKRGRIDPNHSSIRNALVERYNKLGWTM